MAENLVACQNLLRAVDALLSNKDLWTQERYRKFRKLYNALSIAAAHCDSVEHQQGGDRVPAANNIALNNTQSADLS